MLRLTAPDLRGYVLDVYRKHRGEDADYTALAALVSRAETATDERNAVSHSVWGAGSTPETVTRIDITSSKADGVKVEWKRGVTASEMHAIAKTIRVVAHDVERFTWDHLRHEQVGYVEVDEDGTVDLSKATTKPPPVE